MMVFWLVVLGVFLAIIGAGWALGSIALGLAFALIAFGCWGIYMAMNSPLQLQPIPFIALMIGLVLLIAKIGAVLG